MDGQEIWDDFYRKQPRAWRGFKEVPNLGLPKNSKVLDTGCGNGKTCSCLIGLDFDVTGIDFSSCAIKSCSEIYGDKAVFVTGDCLDLPFSDSVFDGVYAVHITENFDDGGVRRFSSECFRVLKPGGKLFVRSFSPEDMRSDKPVRDGIRYVHRMPEEITALFSEFTVSESRLVEEKTKFGSLRSRSECILSKPL
ncbi:MAG: class I SAM-dependent methyltransferase [Candidatus Methanomethylophilaceae archaeon]|jgi:ubiquinone/menaquinone biosynthesis C-methylase UbiE